jgi:hypothetical protein
MAAMTTAQEYQAIREAIQQLCSVAADGSRKDIVSFNVAGMSVSYSSNQLDFLQSREKELAARLTAHNRRKRTIPDHSY